MLLIPLSNMIFKGCVIFHYGLHQKLISFSLFIITFVSTISGAFIYTHINKYVLSNIYFLKFIFN